MTRMRMRNAILVVAAAIAVALGVRMWALSSTQSRSHTLAQWQEGDSATPVCSATPLAIPVPGEKRPQEPPPRSNAVTLSGRVVDSLGNPQENIDLSLPLAGCRTDAEGRFEFKDAMGLLGEGEDRGLLHIGMRKQQWYMKKRLGPLSAGSTTEIDVGEIRLPPFDVNSGIRGKVVGDQDILPNILYLISEDRSIVAILGVSCQTRSFQQAGIPYGAYTLSNCNLAGTPIPKNASPQTCRIELRKGEMVEVTLPIRRSPLP